LQGVLSPVTNLAVAVYHNFWSKVPSSDTLLRGIKELAVENTEVISSNGNNYFKGIRKKNAIMGKKCNKIQDE
jgi:hypothetical protein